MNGPDPAAELPLGYWLKRAYLALTAHLNDLLRPHDLTYSQWQVLSLVGKSAPEPVTQRQIQKCLRVESATLTGVIDGLERRGWLVRQANTQDRRVNELLLTESGTALFQELAPSLAEQVQSRLLRGLSAGQVALTREVLQQVAQNLEPEGE